MTRATHLHAFLDSQSVILHVDVSSSMENHRRLTKLRHIWGKFMFKAIQSARLSGCSSSASVLSKATLSAQLIVVVRILSLSDFSEQRITLPNNDTSSEQVKTKSQFHVEGRNYFRGSWVHELDDASIRQPKIGSCCKAEPCWQCHRAPSSHHEVCKAELDPTFKEVKLKTPWKKTYEM